MSNLTKVLVEKLPAKESNYTIWDDKIAGFGVRVAPSGRKTYIMKYRTHDGRQRKPKIGIHGSITCEQAREIARDWHGQLARTIDPIENQCDARQSPTVSSLCDRFIKEYVEVRKKDGGIWLDKFYIRKYIKPKLGTLKTISVTRNDISKFHLSMKDTPAQANRIMGALSKMFNLAEDWGLRDRHTNPVEGIQKYKETARERYLSNEELVCLGQILEQSEKNGSETVYFVSLVRLLLLTGARLREIMHAKWEWVNKDTGLLLLPDSKTGKKIIHLSPAALEVLEFIPRLKGNPYIIIGGKEKQPLIDAKKPWKRIKDKVSVELLRDDEDYCEIIYALQADLQRTPTYAELCKEVKKQELEKPIGITDVRMHDLRHTYASIKLFAFPERRE